MLHSASGREGGEAICNARVAIAHLNLQGQELPLEPTKAPWGAQHMVCPAFRLAFRLPFGKTSPSYMGQFEPNGIAISPKWLHHALPIPPIGERIEANTTLKVYKYTRESYVLQFSLSFFSGQGPPWGRLAW